MGIEAIGSAIGSTETKFSARGRPASGWGSEIKGVYLPKVINEGPVSHADLINTMPILKIGKLNPIKEIRFNEPKRLVEPMVMPWVLPDVKPAVETLPKLHPVTGVRVANRPAQSVSPAASPAQEVQEVEELVEEKKKVEDPKEILEEEKVTDREIFVEDIEVTAQRRWDIKGAIKKAKEIIGKLGLEKLTGVLIAKLMPTEYAGVRSQVVKNAGPDGSYQDTIHELAGAGEFVSEIAAEEKADQVVAEKKPVKFGKNGLPLAFEHVVRVFKYWLFKPVPVYEVIKRVIRKKIQIAVQVQTAVAETKSEKSLEELDPTLAGVFQKVS